jgi:hypothetical protein
LPEGGPSCQHGREEIAMTLATPGVPAPAHRSFLERVIGALRLDAATYDEIEHDPTSLGQAAGVVVIASVAAAIGAAGQQGSSAVGAVLGSLVGWLMSTAFIWLVGVFWMKHTSDFKELLRTLGFASAPQILFALAGIPGLGVLVVIAGWAWGLAAWVVAARQALDVTTGRAVLVCFLAVLVNGACILGLGLLLAGLLGGGRVPGAVGL